MASTIPLDTLKASTVHSPRMKSVKALAESASLSSLPSIYSFTHNPHDETIIPDDAEDSVPIIDVSLLVSGTPEEQSQVVHQLNKACSDWGCFMVQFSYLLNFSFLLNFVMCRLWMHGTSGINLISLN